MASQLRFLESINAVERSARSIHDMISRALRNVRISIMANDPNSLSSIDGTSQLLSDAVNTFEKDVVSVFLEHMLAYVRDEKLYLTDDTVSPYGTSVKMALLDSSIRDMKMCADRMNKLADGFIMSVSVSRQIAFIDRAPAASIDIEDAVESLMHYVKSMYPFMRNMLRGLGAGAERGADQLNDGRQVQILNLASHMAR